MSPRSFFILANVLLLVVGCETGMTTPISNAAIIAAKVECAEAGMKVQVHLRNSHAITAICVPLSVYDLPPPDVVVND